MTEKIDFDFWNKEPPDDEPEDDRRRSWQRVDLTDVLAGRYTPPMPTVGRRTDGGGLFYPGRVHSIASESEAGKTWLVLSAADDELRAGNAVIYLDFEDDEGGVVGRLMALGTDREAIRDRFAYLQPEEPIGATGNRTDVQEALGDLTPTLAVLDGITEAMVMHGLNPLDNRDVASFGRIVPGWIARQGPASVNCDHVTKDREGRGRYALGGVHKLNGLNGAAYVLDNRMPFGIGITGRSTVKIAKDRPGQLRRHALPSSGGMTWYGDLVLTSHAADFAEVELTPPVDRGENFRPTVLMARIAAALAEHGPLAQRRIIAAVHGNTESKRNALDCLILDGYVSDGTPHKLIRPYSSEDNDS